MPTENQNPAPFPAIDPLGVAEAATDGGVRDVLKIAADNMGELNQQAAIASAERQSEDTEREQQQNTSEPGQRRETERSQGVVRRGTGETVQTIL